MTTAACAPEMIWETAPGRRAASVRGLPVLVVNMGLEEIQKQAKAS